MARRVSHGPRTMALLRADGWEPEVCERIVPMWRGGEEGTPEAGGFRATKKKDLFGFGDLICLPLDDDDPMRGLLIVQICSQSTFAEHERKLLAEARLSKFMRCGGDGRGAHNSHHVEIWAWYKRKLSRGSVAIRWWAKRYKAVLTAQPDFTSTVSFELTDEIGPGHPLLAKVKDMDTKSSSKRK